MWRAGLAPEGVAGAGYGYRPATGAAIGAGEECLAGRGVDVGYEVGFVFLYCRFKGCGGGGGRSNLL